MATNMGYVEVGDTYIIENWSDDRRFATCAYGYFISYRVAQYTDDATTDGKCRVEGVVQTYDLAWSEQRETELGMGVCNAWVFAALISARPVEFGTWRSAPRTNWSDPALIRSEAYDASAPCSGSTNIREVAWGAYIPLSAGVGYRWPSADFRDFKAGNTDFEFGTPWQFGVAPELEQFLCPASPEVSLEYWGNPYTVQSTPIVNGDFSPGQMGYGIASKTACPNWTLTLPGAVPLSGKSNLDEALSSQWQVEANIFLNSEKVWNYNIKSAGLATSSEVSDGVGLISLRPANRYYYRGEDTVYQFDIAGQEPVSCGGKYVLSSQYIYNYPVTETEVSGKLDGNVCTLNVPTSTLSDEVQMDLYAYVDFGAAWYTRYSSVIIPKLIPLDRVLPPTLVLDDSNVGMVDVSASGGEQQGLALWLDATASTQESQSRASVTSLAGFSRSAPCAASSIAEIETGMFGGEIPDASTSCTLHNGRYDVKATFMDPTGMRVQSCGTLTIARASRTLKQVACKPQNWTVRFTNTGISLKNSAAAAVADAAAVLRSVGTKDTIMVTGYASTAGAKALARAKALRRALRAAGVTAPIAIRAAKSNAAPAKQAKADLKVVWGVSQ